MSLTQPKQRIKWYRSPVSREELAMLNQRSDWKGFAQTGGHLGLLILSSVLAWMAAENQAWGWLILILFIHGTMYHFLLNAFHELCHSSVFKTKALNVFFLRLISFLSLHNPVAFWASHQEHHKYTLHPPDDLEVIFPVHLPLGGFLQSIVINPWGFWQRFKGAWRLSNGQIDGEWMQYLFREDDKLKRDLILWARIHLYGHAALLVVSLALGYWMIPVLITFANFYGGWLLYLCNTTQHIGLQDEVADYRLCTRTIILNPVVRFLYWHMNYHIEHHMYAAVPCYNLGKLHTLIKDDLPHCPNGLYETWSVILGILKKQKEDPTYQYMPELPNFAAV
ncbi:MAG: fatty acid desaturase [Chloroflexota bacterium]